MLRLYLVPPRLNFRMHIQAVEADSWQLILIDVFGQQVKADHSAIQEVVILGRSLLEQYYPC